MFVEIYRGYEIYKEPYGFTLNSWWDETFYKTIEEIRNFIDEIWERYNLEVEKTLKILETFK